MPEMTRTWVVPSSTKLPELRFDIREPPLTGDNLGLKTWGTAFAVVKRLEEFGSKYFGHLLEGEKINLNTANTASAKAKVLELGSGTGLVGIAAGTIWGIHVVLTDLPEIEQNLLFNISQNVDAVESMGGSIQGEILDWKNPNSLAHYPYAEFEVTPVSKSFLILQPWLTDTRSSSLPTRSMTMNTQNSLPKTSIDTSSLTNPLEF